MLLRPLATNATTIETEILHSDVIRGELKVPAVETVSLVNISIHGAFVGSI